MIKIFMFLGLIIIVVGNDYDRENYYCPVDVNCVNLPTSVNNECAKDVNCVNLPTPIINQCSNNVSCSNLPIQNNCATSISCNNLPIPINNECATSVSCDNLPTCNTCPDRVFCDNVLPPCEQIRLTKCLIDTVQRSFDNIISINVPNSITDIAELGDFTITWVNAILTTLRQLQPDLINCNNNTPC